jgi:predicted lipoprotein with Yx(FWY)xxD motif
VTRFSLSFAAIAAIAALVVGSGTGSAATVPSPRSATVHSAASPLGRILVDAGGHTLYLFEKDKGARSACAGTCATYWPPLLAQGKSRSVAERSSRFSARRGEPTGRGR